MANRVPLIVDTTTLNIKELPAGDSLDLTNSGIVNAGVITATSFSGSLTGIGTGADKIKVVDESSDTSCNIIYATDPVGYFEPKSGSNLTFNSNTGQLNATIFSGTTVSATTVSATTGTFTGNVSVAGTLTYEDVTNQDVLGLSTFRSGIRINTGGINVTAGISTFGGNIDANGTLDVDGQTDLDVLNVAETATFSALIDANARLDVVGGATVDQLNVAGVSTFNGASTFKAHGTFEDNKQLRLGTGPDIVFYHDQSNTRLTQNSTAAGDLIFDTSDGATTIAKFLKGTKAVELYYGGASKIETRTDGAAVVGILTASGLNVVTGVSTFHNDVILPGATKNIVWDKSDQQLEINGDNSNVAKVAFGDSHDLQIYKGASNGQAFIHNASGTLNITQNSGTVKIDKNTGDEMAHFNIDGSVQLFHNSLERFATSVDGSDFGGTGAIGITKGTTAQRPSSPAAGDFRYNTTTEKFEGYTTKWGAIGGGTEEVDNIVSQTTATGVGTMAVAEYRAASVKALIQQGTNYQVGRYLMIHDNSSVTVVEESAVATGSMLGSFDGVISGGNAVLRVTMVSAASTAVVTTLIDKITI